MPHPPPAPRPAGPVYSQAEWQQLIDYLCREGEPAAHAAVEQRLASDPAFAAFAAPLLAAWQVPRVPLAWDVDAGWARFQQRRAAPQAERTGAVPRPSRPAARARAHPRWWHVSLTRWATLAAAAVVLVVSVRVIYPSLRIQNRYRGGATGAVVTLPDGSRATLAPGSYLATERGFPRTTRTVHLFGDAQFQVVHSSRVPFLVHALGVGTRVLGTTFHMHVDTLPVVQIDVTQGAVAVGVYDAAGHWRPLAVLTPGQAVHVPLLARFMAHAGADVREAGVPFVEAMRIGLALRRAVLHAGTAAARHRAP